MTAIAAAQELFVQIVGRDPEGVWSSPGRANLIGEHTDYNDGFVLPFAIAQRTDAALGLRDDRRIRVSSTFTDGVVEIGLDDLDDLFPSHHDRVPEWATYPLGVAWAILQTTDTPTSAVSGFDLAIASEVPVGGGLSSSAAIEGAVSSALNDVWGLGLTAVELAKVGRKAENEAVGAPTGIMDQMASMLGQPDAAIFLDCRSLETQIINLGLEPAGLELLVIDTKVQHSHSTGGYRERRESCEKGAAIMGVPALRDLTIDDLTRAEKLMDDVTFRRVRHIVTENQRVLDTVATLAASGPLAIGDLLLASHASMRDDFEISIAELDTAVEASVAAGAVGARMTGGGFGGAAIALVHADDAVSVAEAVEKAFADAGFTAPHVFPVYPSQGARRDW
ncbi:galactokinase [Microbacterium halimionae]|uniref:Galactokinase n=1 Tax=Microbacterium halimionae TaxID=1526413 RepID=A0A7W3JLU2_9MICO|nr:galactokinase [Microbacterium halimionae]MBA8815193.1 galactokinase [Microbacterium halimionae]NII94016.1 galactokinase [Microbacterium halimionae]